MTYEQAINYLRSSGMSDEQIETVVNAIKSELIDGMITLLNEVKDTKECIA